MNTKLLSWKYRILHFSKPLFSTLRLLVGPPTVCIYPIDCPQYAEKLFLQKPLFIALPLIIIRILSCNPVTVLIWKMKIAMQYRKSNV